MKIYISGISGTGMGPLALMAKQAGLTVFGSDKNAGMILPELETAGIEVKIGEQDGEFLKQKIADGVDWFVYTSALPKDHPELIIAKESGVRVTKRDELTEYLVRELNLKMVAVAGTHGKTTTTSMIIFAALKLGIPVAYIVGTTLGFAPSGSYKPGDEFFIYEADEYDRNFLMFHPWLAVFPSVTYDHPDVYPTREDYLEAFSQFKAQCENVIDEINGDVDFKLAGAARRRDAELAMTAILNMAPEIETEKVKAVLDEFPGVGRRFERLADGIYTDYAHHPEEIAAPAVGSLPSRIHFAMRCQSCRPVVLSGAARFFRLRSRALPDSGISPARAAESKSPSRSRRSCACSPGCRRNTRYVVFHRRGRQLPQ